jgi:hypothetical protein
MSFLSSSLSVSGTAAISLSKTRCLKISSQRVHGCLGHEALPVSGPPAKSRYRSGCTLRYRLRCRVSRSLYDRPESSRASEVMKRTRSACKNCALRKSPDRCETCSQDDSWKEGQKSSCKVQELGGLQCMTWRGRHRPAHVLVQRAGHVCSANKSSWSTPAVAKASYQIRGSGSD